MGLTDGADGEGGDDCANTPHVPAKSAGIGAHMARKEFGVVGAEYAAGTTQAKSDDRSPPEQEHGILYEDVDGDGNRAQQKGDHHRAATSYFVGKQPKELKTEKHTDIHDDRETQHGRDV